MNFKRLECLGNGYTGLGGKLINEGWQVHQKGKDKKFSVPVPGNVRLALMDAGEISNPFVGKNNKDSQWVSLVEWVYSNQLDLNEWKTEVNENFVRGGLVHVCFDAIDYDASFILNKKSICDQKGMFSPVDLVCGFTAESKEETKQIPVEIRFHVQPFWRQHAVKSQMSFGWDFAPEIRTIGLWKNARMYYTGPAFFKNAYAVALSNDSGKSVQNCTIAFAGKITRVNPEMLELDTAPKTYDLKVVIGDREQLIPIKVDVSGDFKVELADQRVPQWMPWSMGAPQQVPVVVQLLKDGVIYDEYRGKVVNRHVKWNRNPGTIKGHENWTLTVNGKKMFLRGINWVPPDSLYGRISEERYKKLVNAALDMNVDIIRVWGGGIEEKTSFYDYCDKVGMMVWQEFPFACTNYPDDPNYMKIVRKECNGIVERTRSHPCVVNYCGGNEFNPFINSHIINAVRNAVSMYAPDRFCFAASPFQGDDHNWRYWGLRRMFDAFEVDGVGPFQMLTEYGMQAAPDLETLETCIGKENSESIGKIKVENVKRVLDYHKTDLNGFRSYAEKFSFSIEDLSSFVINTQRLQAYALKYAIEVCRSAWPNVSGVMPWQLSDPWPNVSWSVIDYFYRPKMSYKMIKTSYSPILPMVRNWRKTKRSDKNQGNWRQADIVIHNSTQNDFDGSLEYDVARGEKIIFSRTVDVRAPSDCALRVGTFIVNVKSGVVVRVKIFDAKNKLVAKNFNFPTMEPIASKLNKIRDIIDARFDGWWRKHMTYLMEIDKICEERPNWKKKRKDFYTNVKKTRN